MATKVLADAIGRGLHSARPTDNNADALTGTIGRLYYETDTHQLFRDNGTTWDQLYVNFDDLVNIALLGLATGDILTYVGSVWGNYARGAIPLSDWGAATADMDAGGTKLTNMADPISGGDAATKTYVDTAVAGVTVPTNLSQLDPADDDIDLGTHKLVNVVDPTSPQDAATKQYVDDNVGGGGGGGPVTALVFGAELYQTAPATGEFGTTDPNGDNMFYALTTPSNIPAVDDEWSAGFMLAGGTYRMTVHGKKTPGGCIIDWYIDGVSQVTGQDYYADPEENNDTFVDTVVVSGDGPHVLKLIITGQNPSSSDFIWAISAVKFQPTT